MFLKSIYTTFVLLLMASTLLTAEEFTVIVNKANSASDIKKSSLKRIYLGKMKQWKGSKVIPINLPETDKTAQTFIKKVTRMGNVIS